MKPCDPLTSALLAAGPWVRAAAPHAVVEVDGPDAGDFLQRLCSQDVLALAPGALAPAAFLDAKGKVVATCLVARRTDGAGYWLELQAAQAPRLLALLERFHFTEKLRFAARAGAAVERIQTAVGPGRNEVAADGDALGFAFARRGVQFERWHGGAAAVPAGSALDAAVAECLRMGAGLVAVGIDTEPTTLALEADLDDHCSPTKGCYTGQEVVARIHTYGHTNRALCLLHLDGTEPIAAPQTLHETEDDLAVGRVMHAVPLPAGLVAAGPGRVGLGYLPADFQPIGTRLRLADGTAVTVAGFAADAAP